MKWFKITKYPKDKFALRDDFKLCHSWDVHPRFLIGYTGHFRSRFGRVIVAVDGAHIVTKFTRFYYNQFKKTIRI